MNRAQDRFDVGRAGSRQVSVQPGLRHSCQSCGRSSTLNRARLRRCAKCKVKNPLAIPMALSCACSCGIRDIMKPKSPRVNFKACRFAGGALAAVPGRSQRRGHGHKPLADPIAEEVSTYCAPPCKTQASHQRTLAQAAQADTRKLGNADLQMASLSVSRARGRAPTEQLRKNLLYASE